jgi:hypothetical protein
LIDLRRRDDLDQRVFADRQFLLRLNLEPMLAGLSLNQINPLQSFQRITGTAPTKQTVKHWLIFVYVFRPTAATTSMTGRGLPVSPCRSLRTNIHTYIHPYIYPYFAWYLVTRFAPKAACLQGLHADEPVLLTSNQPATV